VSALDVVTLAARTPVGLLAETTAAAIRAGIVNITDYPYALTTGEPVSVAQDTRLPHEISAPRRCEALLASVFHEIDRKLADSPLAGRIHVLLALPQARPGFSDEDAMALAQATLQYFRARGLDTTVEVASRGHAGGVVAFQRAASELQRGSDLPYLVVGVDSYIDPQTLAWLDRNGLLAQRGCPNGFIPGEAAACLVLASKTLRTSMRWPSFGSVRGTGTDSETLLRDSDTGSFGLALTRAVLSAARDLHGQQVDAVYLDINGERYRSEEWGFVALRTQAVWRSLEYDAPADRCGDIGAAWVPLAAVLAVRSFVRGYAPGPLTAILAGSFDGRRGAVLLEARITK
jgi:3-oxoacyl-[acyl-carrier-protein] synthase-1